MSGGFLGSSSHGAMVTSQASGASASGSGVGTKAGRGVVRAVGSTVIEVAVHAGVDLVGNVAVMGTVVGGAARLVGVVTHSTGSSASGSTSTHTKASRVASGSAVRTALLQCQLILRVARSQRALLLTGSAAEVMQLRHSGRE